MLVPFRDRQTLALCILCGIAKQFAVIMTGFEFVHCIVIFSFTTGWADTTLFLLCVHIVLHQKHKFCIPLGAVSLFFAMHFI